MATDIADLTANSVQLSAQQAGATDAPDGDLIAYQLGSIVAGLCRASGQRAWMDQSAERFAYRCLPLVIANQLGWDLLNPIPFRARWLGGSAPTDVQVETQGDCELGTWAIGHFGEGVLTIQVGYLFRTPPGIRLLVTGPLNLPKSCLYPLSGVVETDWTQATFTMNYKFTQPGVWVEFERNEPFCRIVPLSTTLLEALQGRVRSLDDNPQLHSQFREWSQSRGSFIRQLDNPFSEDRRRGWQKDYFQGQRADGQHQQGHQTKLSHREFLDERSDSAELRSDAVRPQQRRRQPVAPATQTSAYDFLWRESRPFENRSRKSVQVMAALAQTIERALPVSEERDRFLNSYRRFCEASSDAFTQVCLEPRAYFWTRVGFQLVDALLNGRELTPVARDYCQALGTIDIRQAVSTHLDRFTEFELAAKCLDDREWNGQDGPRVSACPVLDVGGSSIRLQPAALAGLGLSAVEPTIAAGNDYQWKNADLLRDAVEAIHRYTPEIFEQIREHVRVIALKPDRSNEYTNVSFSELPGAMLLTVVDHPLAMADRIIHEFHHHRLFAIEDGDALLEPNATAGQRLARYYSPWRNDLRPIRGILHGLYVYIAVGRFWLSVYEAADRPADRPYALDQLLRIGKQLSLAQDVLASHARFTPIGEGALEQLTADVAALHEHMQRARLPDDAPALLMTAVGEVKPQLSAATGRPLTVAEAIDEHVARFGE